MSTETKTKESRSVDQMTMEELEAFMEKKRADENRKREAEKKAYEKRRDERVFAMMKTAKVLSRELQEFKQYCHIEMDKSADELSQYGKMRGNSKGGFQLANNDNSFRVVRRRDTEPVWDERSVKASELIKSFLTDTVKKKDLNLYEILLSFLERNANGELEYSRVMDLIKHEDKYDDSRWREGLKLIKESFQNHFKGYGYVFQEKDESGKWQTLNLNFSSL